ncbi:DUF6538 domain-containing protein [Ferrovibrio sp.]|uniref:DUF6538 domain-containing protein n=1 Tax=Ferrovibrio sp. TaxID=1917215 RepID=UPI00391A1155
MTDMTSIPHLKRTRDNIYQYRRVIPPALRSKFGGKTEITISLKTSDLAEAKLKMAPIAADAERQLAAARRGKVADLDLLRAVSVVGGWLDAIYNDVLLQDMYDSDMISGPIPPFNSADELKASVSHYLDYLRRMRQPPSDTVLTHVFRLAPAEYHRDHTVRQAMPDYDGDFGGLPPEDQIAFEPFRFARDILALPKPPESSATPVPPPVVDESRTPLSELLNRYLAKKQYPSNTEHEWRLAWRRLIEYVGDIAIGDLRKFHLIQWREMLQRCPLNLTRFERRLALPDIIRIWEKKGIKYHMISRHTVDKYFTAIRTVLNWAEGRIIDASPARDLKPDAAPKEAAARKRLPFSTEDHLIIFGSTVYRGFKSAKYRSLPGKKIIEDAAYWLPLLALYTGARLEELGQLLLEDIRQYPIDGFYYIDITDQNDETKRLKTLGSLRQVPIHSELVRWGFLKYVQRMHDAGHHRLFPDLRKDKRGSYTQKFSRDWNRWLRKLGIEDDRKVFHSFRHGFKDAARAAGIEKALRDRLQGHAVSDVAETYGNGWTMSDLAEAIEKIKYSVFIPQDNVKRDNRMVQE